MDKITALYCRLSIEDRNGRDESNSITNQKEILSRYAKEHGFTNTRLFTDDGISGTIFDRPGLNAMRAEVETGNVATVIVKDRSRLGRSVGENAMLSSLFSRHNVRYIAVLNNSDTADSSQFDFLGTIYDAVNELYVSDLSNKTRASFRNKALNGKHAHGQAPYGYKPSERDKFVWMIDEPAAEIVRRIFDMCKNNIGIVEIGKALHAEGIKNPLAYKAVRDGVAPRRKLKYPDTTWNHKTISTILENREYLGEAVIGKITSKSYKNRHKYTRPEEEWTIHENAHEFIIDRDTFETVQRIRSTRHRRAKAGDMGVLNGIMFCADCGSRMRIKRQVKVGLDGTKITYDYYVCSKSILPAGYSTCTLHSIKRQDIEVSVLAAIQEVFIEAKSDETQFAERLKSDKGKETAQRLSRMRTELSKANKQISDIDETINMLYSDRTKGIITVERFQSMLVNYESKQEMLKAKVSEFEQFLNKIEVQSSNADRFISIVRKRTDVNALTAEVVNDFIEKVLIGKPEYIGHRQKKQSVEILFNYIGNISGVEVEK